MQEFPLLSPITQAEVRDVTMHFRQPFAIAYETVTDARVALVCLRDEVGRQGIGSAAPDEEVTQEKIGSTLAALRRVLTPAFFDGCSSLDSYQDRIAAALADLPAAQSALAEAALSLLLQQRGESLATLFPPIRTSCPATVTIGIQDVDATLIEVKQRLNEGFRCIKLKCGTDLERDLRVIERTLDMLPPDCKLLLDANQGYSMEQARTLLETVRGWNIALIEQPVAAENWEGLRELHRMGSIPVIADESAASVQDALELLKGDYVDGVNVKLMKCGGPLNASAIIRAAQEKGKIVILGCMYESAASLTTAAHLALAYPIDYVDLDSGHMDFDDDPVMGGMCVQDGRISIPEPVSLAEPKL